MGKERYFWKILRFNLLAILAVFLLAEAASWCLLFYNLNYHADYSWLRSEKSGKLLFPSYFYKIQDFEETYAWAWVNFRPVAEPANAFGQRPIVALGCSYTYGWGLPNDQTYPYKLAHIMGRKVFSRAIGGWGPQHMLYQLENDNELKDIKNPEFVIFLHMRDHLRRIKGYLGQSLDVRDGLAGEFIYPSYILENGRLTMKKVRFPWLTRSIFISSMLRYITSLETYGDNIAGALGKRVQLIKMHFQQSYEAAKKRWPETKFVLLMWPKSGLPRAYIEELKQNKDFHIIWLQDLLRPAENLFADPYVHKLDPPHPSEQAWELLTPIIAKELERM